MIRTISLIAAGLLLALPLSAIAQLPLPGTEAPLFTLPDLDGKVQSFADYRGKVVLLVFWATWCPSCVAELPALDRLHGTMKEKGFSVLAVSLDGRTEPVRTFLREKNLSLPVPMDSEKEASFDLYAVTALPVAFLMDRKGIIVEKLIGERNWDDAALRSRIADLVGGKEKMP